MIFETLKIDEDYEITEDVYPYVIRRKDNHKCPKIRTEPSGYQRITLNNKPYYFHQVVAYQYLNNLKDNPNNYKEVDHFDKNKSNNRIRNLRYVDHSTNCKNKSSYNSVPCHYTNILSKDAIKITTYQKYMLDSYYFDEGCFYYFNGAEFRELHVNEVKNKKTSYVYARDKNNKQIKIYINKFMKLYNIKKM